MSKKSNTVLFLVAATVFNIVATIASFLVLFFLYAKFLAPVLPAEAAPWGLPFVFTAAIALAFVLYRMGIKLLVKKVDVDKTFDPLFFPRGKKR